MENDSTHSLDSIRVDTSEVTYYQNPPMVHGVPGHTYQIVRMALKNYTSSLSYIHCLLSHSIVYNEVGPYGVDGQPFAFFDQPVDYTFRGDSVKTIYTTFPVNGFTFNRVTLTKVTAAAQYQHEFNNDTYFYLSDSIGVVKVVTDLGSGNFTSCSIKRWNVIKMY